MNMTGAKMVKGHYITNGNIQTSDGAQILAFGDEFDLVDIHKNNKAEIMFNHKNYIFLTSI